MSNMKKKVIFSLFIVLSLLLTSLTLQQVSTRTEEIRDEIEVNSYVSSSPLFITSDSDFGPSGYNLPGDGSAGSPYLIQNLNITTQSGYGIYIETVTDYFEIRDCYISAENPIYISSITTDYVLISNNTLEVQSGSTPRGIDILFSHHFEIMDNIITGYGSGIYLDNSNFNYIHGNHLSHFTNAIDMWHSMYCSIYDNIFEINDGDEYVTCDYLTFYNNTWIDNNNGLYLGDCTHGNITDNFFLNNSHYAVTLTSTFSTVVYENWFIGNNHISTYGSQVTDISGSNSWNYMAKGNFYDDYSGEGPYEIDDDRYDYYPIWDTDSDQLNDYYELFIYNTDRYDWDSDDDYLPDGYEILQNLNPLLADAHEDPDTDGLTNLEEYAHGTLCQDEDTDGDVMTDGYEVNNSLNPLFDDANLDFDGDELTNLAEFLAGTKANNYDSDSDGMSDSWEIDNSLNPLENDAWADPDHDNLSNFHEYIYGCNPNLNDTDSDGYSDSWEVLQGTNPNDDQDFPDLQEPDPEDTSSLTDETTYYWLFGFVAIMVLGGIPIILQRIRLSKLRGLVKEYFPRLKL